MATDTTLDGTKGDPQVTIECGFPQWYAYRLVLWKPDGQNWPETGKPWKIIGQGVFDKGQNAKATFPIGQPAAQSANYSLSWEVYVKVPGGGAGQYSVTISVTQAGVEDPVGSFPSGGAVTNTAAVSDITDFKVS